MKKEYNFVLFFLRFGHVGLGVKSLFADISVKCADIMSNTTDIPSKCADIVLISADIRPECADIINFPMLSKIFSDKYHKTNLHNKLYLIYN